MGFAPPAGHVDDDDSFLAAAQRELHEEVGIARAELTLVAQGRKSNGCRREYGTWHYWRIYVAKPDKESIQLSEREVKSARWCGQDELLKLELRTQSYLKGEVPEDEWLNSPGLEPVWVEWLHQIGCLPSIGGSWEGAEAEAAAQEAAREHAWSWFSYHAGQRQVVFRFFVILVGALLAGYISVRGDGNASVAFALGLLIAFLSLLFWRLDIRSIMLVKLAERSLKISEAHLAGVLASDEVRIAKAADEKPAVGMGVKGILDRYLFSFRQIYRAVFVVGILLGLLLMALSFVGGNAGPSGSEVHGRLGAASEQVIDQEKH